MSTTYPTVRALYLQLAAAGVDMHTGDLTACAGSLSELEIARLHELVRRNRSGLEEVLSGSSADLRAVREEGL